jgi:hypothetical protein
MRSGPTVHGGVRTALALVVLLAAAGPGCRDDVVQPTLGRIDVRIEGASGAEVYLDGEYVGTDPKAPLGPIPAGSHVVGVVRECFETLPSREVAVEVIAGEITSAGFVLEARDFGSAAVSGADELTGEPVPGAEILVETAPGVFTGTGRLTPAVVDSLPCGTTRFRLRKAEYADSPPVVARIDTGARTDVRVELGPLHGVLAEMTTYTFCPNCPPSVDELDAIQAAYPEVSVVEWHTASSFPFYDDRWKAREVYYTGVPIGTWPALIVQGMADSILVGSSSSTLQHYWPLVERARQECGGPCPVALSADAVIGAGQSVVTARVKWRHGTLPGALKLRFVLLEDEVAAPGPDSPYSDVPRDYHEEPVVFAAPGEILVRAHTFPLDPGWITGNLHGVVYLQSDATRRILATHGF